MLATRRGEVQASASRTRCSGSFLAPWRCLRRTDARALQQAARQFAKAELANHRYVMVLHKHQANPHVPISVRAEGRDGSRLNPRKEDLRRWREAFAERLRG